MCDLCGTGGACICRAATPENAGTRYGPDLGDRARLRRQWIADYRGTLAELEAELAGLTRARQCVQDGAVG